MMNMRNQKKKRQKNTLKSGEKGIFLLNRLKNIMKIQLIWSSGIIA